MYIGNELCGLFDMDQNFSPSHVKCMQAREQEAGRYNVTEHTSIGVASKDFRLRKTSLSVGEYYEHSVLPTVSQISPNEGLVTGQDVVITGTGFSKTSINNVVTIDGVNCEVTSATFT